MFGQMDTLNHASIRKRPDWTIMYAYHQLQLTEQEKVQQTKEGESGDTAATPQIIE